MILALLSFESERRTKRPPANSLSPSPWKLEVITRINGATFHLSPAHKLLPGSSSSPSRIAAFNFGFDAVTAHAELKVQGDTVTWEPQGVKGHDPRLRGKENKSRWGRAMSAMMSSY